MATSPIVVHALVPMIGISGLDPTVSADRPGEGVKPMIIGTDRRYPSSVEVPATLFLRHGSKVYNELLSLWASGLISIAVNGTGITSFSELNVYTEDLLRVARIHLPIVTPSRASGPPGQLPGVEAKNALSYIVFDGVAGAQLVFRTLKIPFSYVRNASFHIHWTKSDDIDRSGETVRWQINYSVYDGRTQDAAATPTVLQFDDVYNDSGIATRIVQRIPDQLLVGVTAGYYISLSVEKGTPGGSPLADPALVAVDLIFDTELS